MPANKLYVNIGTLVSSITDANLSTVTWQGATVGNSLSVLGLLSTPGSAVLRDMGKTVYLPANSTSAVTSTMLRKVQLLVPGVPAGIDGTGAGTSTDYLTGYIQIGGMTYGGGAPQGAKVARLN